MPGAIKFTREWWEDLNANKPTAAFVLSLVGGIIIYVVGFIRAIRFTAPGVFGIICGTPIILGSIMLYTKPGKHRMWSTIIVIFSILSWLGVLGGLVIGFVLSLTGAILGFRWKPAPHPQTPQPSRSSPPSSNLPNKYCFSCGQEISREHKFCPYCGKPLPE